MAQTVIKSRFIDGANRKRAPGEIVLPDEYDEQTLINYAKRGLVEIVEEKKAAAPRTKKPAAPKETK